MLSSNLADVASVDQYNSFCHFGSTLILMISSATSRVEPTSIVASTVKNHDADEE